MGMDVGVRAARIGEKMGRRAGMREWDCGKA